MILSSRALAGTALVSIAILSGCSSSSGDSDDMTINVAVQEVTAMNFNPALNNDTTSFQLSPLYDTLVRQLGDGTMEPNLATAWEYTSPTELVLDIRTDVTFSDGEPVTTDDVVASLEAVQSSGGFYASGFADITSIVATDEDTVTVEFSAPAPTFVNLLATPAGMVAPESAISAGTLETDPVGSGPYTLESSSPGQSYRYAKREDYWNAEHFPIEAITVTVMDDDNAKINALRTGQVDIIENQPNATIQDLVNDGTIAFEAAPYNTNFLLLMDRDGVTVPALGDKRVRQAINYALDREGIAAIGGEGLRDATTQLIKPGQPGYVEELDSAYAYDPERARALLAEAGYPDGFTFNMVNISYFDPQAQALVAQLAEIGIDAQITNVPIGDYVSSIMSGDYPAAYFAYQVVDPYADLTRLTANSAAFNPFNATSNEVDAAFDQARQSTTDEELDVALAGVNTILVEDAWFATFLYDYLGYATNPELQGVDFSVVRPPSYYNWSF